MITTNWNLWASINVLRSLLSFWVTVVKIARDLFENKSFFVVLFDWSFGFQRRVKWGLAENGRGCIIFVILTIILKLRNFGNNLIVLTVLISCLLVTVKNLLAELNILADMTVYIDVHIRDLLLHDV